MNNQIPWHGRPARVFESGRHGRAAHATGMTLVELLISMAITSMLLVGLCATFHASMSAVQFGNSYIRCTQTARDALSRIVTEVRQADAVQVNPAGTSVQVIRPADKLTTGEIYRQFSFDAATKRITTQVFHADGGSSPVYEVAEDIAACTFGPADVRPGIDNAPTTVRVPISITCSVGGNSITLTGAASPRRVAYNHGQ